MTRRRKPIFTTFLKGGQLWRPDTGAPKLTRKFGGRRFTLFSFRRGASEMVRDKVGVKLGFMGLKRSTRPRLVRAVKRKDGWAIYMGPLRRPR